MHRMISILIKEFKQIFRTREMLGIIFGIPIIQLLIMGFAFTTEVKHIKLIICDDDNSKFSQQMASAFSTTDRFEIVKLENNRKIIADDIQGWKAQMAIIIPSNFYADLKRGLKPKLQIIVDGLDGNTAGIAVGYAQGILSEFGQVYLSSTGLEKLVKTRIVRQTERMWYNDNLESSQFMIPGIVVVLLTIISMMLSSMSLVKEKELGTLEQLLVTPLQKHELLLGKILPFLFLAFFELILVMQLAQVIFGVHMQGSYALLYGLAFIYLFTTLGFGVLISTFTATQQQAMFVSWFFMVFMLLMSGLFVPIENMPMLMRKLTYLNPMRYFMYIIRDIFEKGSSLQYLLNNVIPMSVYGLSVFSLSILKFHKKVN